MRFDEIEEALQELVPDLGPQGLVPQGIVITLRRHDEYEVLIERIRSLEAEVQRKDRELHQMATYSVLYLQALDELRMAVRLLSAAGLDVSWVRSLKVRRGNARA